MGGFGGPMGGFGGQGGVASSESLKTLEVVSLKDFLDPAKKYQPAQFVKPIEAIIVHAAFPWRQQLEEHARALRYRDVAELLANAADFPRFEGVKVQRRIHFPNGQTTEWSDHDWVAYYDPIFREKIEEDEMEAADLRYVIPPEDSELVIPMPKLARGRYLELNLDSIRRTIEKAKQAPAGRQFGGWANKGQENRASPFSRGAREKLQEKPDDKPDDKNQTPNYGPETILIRFLDVDVKPGNGYEYRVQVRMTNPNFGKKSQVARPDHAMDKQLLSEPALVSFKVGDKTESIVRAPVDRFVYAYTPESRETLRTDYARVQVHSWLSHVRTDRTRVAKESFEPLGDWVVEDIQVGRGQPVLGVKNVKVPIWSAEKNQFQFMEFATVRSAGGSRVKGALPVDINAPHLLVDFEGYSRRTETVRYGKMLRDITDEAGMELLMLGADGKLRVRSYWSDMADQQRYERESGWLNWLKTVRDASDTNRGSQPNDPFGKGGGGPNG